MTRVSLEKLAHDEDVAEANAADLVVELPLSEPPAPEVFRNLVRLEQLGLLTGDALLSLVGQAPVDPIGLYATMRHASSEGWVFSALDFSVLRILARDERGVRASIRIDLLSDDVTIMVRRNGALALFRGIVGSDLAQLGAHALSLLQQEVDSAIAAAQ